MRYVVHARDGAPLAMLGFSTARLTLAPRDRFIGWSRRHREKNLPLVVDNPRFLILPWIRIPNLGSHILALVRHQLPADWTARYKTTPVLIATLVETPRYTGAVYRVSGWIRGGATGCRSTTISPSGCSGGRPSDGACRSAPTAEPARGLRR